MQAFVGGPPVGLSGSLVKASPPATSNPLGGGVAPLHGGSQAGAANGPSHPALLGFGAPPQAGVRKNAFGAPPTSAFGRGDSAAPPLASGGVGPALVGLGSRLSAPALPPPPTVSELSSRSIATAQQTTGAVGVAGSPAAPSGVYPSQNPRAVEEQERVASYEAWSKGAAPMNAAPHFLRSTISKVPSIASAKQKVCCPIGFVMQPLAPTPPGEEEVPSVNFANIGTIVRCKSCRTYINPFVQWEANGRRWSCNLCGFSQLTPDTYYASLDAEGKRVDRFQRPELSKGAVEYIAPGEYMVRPPQPPVFMFVIDVSYVSVVTGLLHAIVSTLKEAISSRSLPGGSRTQVGFMTYDTSVHFYNLGANLSQPQMFVVADLEDIFLPLPNDILVNLHENEASIINLLEALPAIFSETKTNESCMGSAVKGAFMAMKHIGGKLMVFGATIPSLGELALKSTRENPRVMGTEKEVEVLRPVNDGYKDLATELTRAQISVELFVAPQMYVDLASIAPLARYTGGDVRLYPQFHIRTQGHKFKSELKHVLSRYMGWEAVMRVRVSRGWKITNFFGHLFIRGADLLVVPNCHSDQTFALAVDIEDGATPDPIIAVQSALLYTNSDGERRIRVLTWAGLTTPNYADIMNSIDVQATAALLLHSTLATCLKTNLTEGRNKLMAMCQQFVSAQNSLSTVEALQFVPLYTLGMLKSPALRIAVDRTADMRIATWSRLESMSVSQMAAYFHPRMMALHDLGPDVGLPDEHGRVVLPPVMNLTSESMTQDGIFMMEDGESILVWIGRSAEPQLLQTLFGASSFEQLDCVAAEARLGVGDDEISQRIGAVLQQVRAERCVPYMQLQIVRQGDPKEHRFFAYLIEDRTIGMQSTYTEFLRQMGYRPPQTQLGPPPMR